MLAPTSQLPFSLTLLCHNPASHTQALGNHQSDSRVQGLVTKHTPVRRVLRKMQQKESQPPTTRELSHKTSVCPLTRIFDQHFATSNLRIQSVCLEYGFAFLFTSVPSKDMLEHFDAQTRTATYRPTTTLPEPTNSKNIRPHISLPHLPTLPFYLCLPSPPKQQLPYCVRG